MSRTVQYRVAKAKKWSGSPRVTWAAVALNAIKAILLYLRKINSPTLFTYSQYSFSKPPILQTHFLYPAIFPRFLKSYGFCSFSKK